MRAPPAAASLLALALVLLPAEAALAAHAGPLGPGPEPWEKEAPAAHGLDPARLASAWAQLHGHVSLGRNCLVVIKDGALVFEAYATDRAINASSVHEGWSMTKTLGAVLAGWATGSVDGAAPALDIDADITRAYGVASPKPCATLPSAEPPRC